METMKPGFICYQTDRAEFLENRRREAEEDWETGFNGWQYISTAPRDGTIVDVWLVGAVNEVSFYCPVLRMNPASQTDSEGRATNWSWSYGKFRPVSGLCRDVLIQPQFWRPLPLGPHDFAFEPKPVPSE